MAGYDLHDMYEQVGTMHVCLGGLCYNVVVYVLYYPSEVLARSREGGIIYLRRPNNRTAANPESTH